MPAPVIHTGNALTVLPTLERGTAQACVTSPPYWGLRDYGDPGQDWPAVEFQLRLGGLDVPVTVPAMSAPLGLEPTPIAYVAHLVAIFREVREVLTDDGTLWVNIGDTYAHHGGGTGQGGISKQAQKVSGLRQRTNQGIPNKNLLGIPWLVAYALRSDGWHLRSDIIWHKRNPMPESVTDRPTKGHEYLFLLAKSERYWCDMGAIREPHSRSWYDEVWRRNQGGKAGNNKDRNDGGMAPTSYNADGRNKRTVWSIASQPYPGAHFAVMPPGLIEPCVLAGSRPGDTVLDPFAGVCTVGVVAERHERHFVGVELSEKYAALGLERVLREREMRGDLSDGDATHLAGPVQLGLLTGSS